MLSVMRKEKLSVWCILLPFSVIFSLVLCLGINYILKSTIYTDEIYRTEVYWREIKSLDLNAEPAFTEFNPYRFRLGNTYPDFYFAVTKTSTQNKESLVQSLKKNEWKEIEDGILAKEIKDKVIYINIQEKNEKVDVFMTPKL